MKFPKGVKRSNDLTLYHHTVTAQVALVTKKQFLCVNTDLSGDFAATAQEITLFI